MKKIILAALSTMAVLAATGSFADIKTGTLPKSYAQGQDYVGTIVAVEYEHNTDGKKTIRIMTDGDKANNASRIPGLTFIVDGDDLPFGLTLAASIGQKVAATFDASHTVGLFEIITDGYWNGASKIAQN